MHNEETAITTLDRHGKIQFISAEIEHYSDQYSLLHCFYEDASASWFAVKYMGEANEHHPTHCGPTTCIEEYHAESDGHAFYHLILDENGKAGFKTRNDVRVWLESHTKQRGITYHTSGSMFDRYIPTLVNTVNCEGYMGKGLALQFKQLFSFTQLDARYKDWCKSGRAKPGMTLPYRLTTDERGTSPELLILNVATKGEWRKDSQLAWIETILQKFVENYERLGITHVAFPKMGCGLGGLKWEQVGPLYRKYLGDLPIQVDVFIGEQDTQF